MSQRHVLETDYLDGLHLHFFEGENRITALKLPEVYNDASFDDQNAEIKEEVSQNWIKNTQIPIENPFKFKAEELKSA